MGRRLLGAFAICLWSTVATAQTHECDKTFPTSLTVSLQAQVLTFCHSGFVTDPSGNKLPITEWRLYQDGGTTPITFTGKTDGVVSASGQKAYTTTITADPGQHTFTVKAFAPGAGESPASNPFVLTVVLPWKIDAPTKLHGS